MPVMQLIQCSQLCHARSVQLRVDSQQSQGITAKAEPVEPGLLSGLCSQYGQEGTVWRMQPGVKPEDSCSPCSAVRSVRQELSS